jgi:hypothetical protein
MRNAIGSHITPNSAGPICLSTSAFSTKVESPGAPEPGLSARSASTSGPWLCEAARSIASGIERYFVA